ncbi:peroxiredoxin [Mariniphaga sediminis]|uniref:peroxiredoxin n=1 Tax=Mariniphaga sediminis TaxID=1628158 RepID=UPI0035642774
MKTILFFLMIAFSFGSFAQSGLDVGDKVPGFTATADNGSTWDLKKHVGKKYLVVYFYPAAMTGGCTAQACAYRDMSSDLQDADALVVGVSGDTPEGLKFFKEAHDLNFTLLSDESGDIARLFGVPSRDGGSFKSEFNGKPFELERGITTSRWTFIIDKKGKIVYKNDEVNARQDTEEVLRFLKNNT